jgi:hypothetical protein
MMTLREVSLRYRVARGSAARTARDGADWASEREAALSRLGGE